MQITRVDDARAWDAALLALPNPHILQSWAWGEFKSRYGWHPTRLRFEEEGEIVAAALVLRRKLPGLPVSILYVPKGPALDWDNAGLAEQVTQELASLARRQRALFIKIDPDVYYSTDAPSFSPRPVRATETGQMLESQGWRTSTEQIQFRNTLLLDLKRPEDQLLANYAAVMDELVRAKPSAAKGKYIKSITVASTMGPGVKVHPTRLRDILEASPAAA